MAADSSCFADETHVYSIRKIFRVGGGLVGAAGLIVDIAVFVQWLRDGAIDGEYPKMTAMEAIVVNPQGRVCAYESEQADPVPVKAPYCAIGAGRDFALGAMHAGADAKNAVKAAIKHHSLVKPPVRVYKLKGMA